ncbi:MAG: alanine--tRNA ligase [Terriglobia bacterium]
MTSDQIRETFLDFFAVRGHRVVRSSSLVPANDQTLLFSNAGMNQFKDIFLGREKRDYTRACSSQKCVRAGGKHNDLEQVGRTARHHTFFEMLGNFSFGDYFKKEAIPWAWELITEVYKIPREKLYVTVFNGSKSPAIDPDYEAYACWRSLGVSEDRIVKLGMKENFWQMGDTGPCGPCSEIHYDMGAVASEQGHADCKLPCDCGRYVELWNLVFMQLEQQGGVSNGIPWGSFSLLPRPCIDTGAGLERLAAVLQGKLSNFDTDLFQPLIREAAELANVEYGTNHESDVSLRIIADHSRAATFLISDGVMPSNEGRGYVLRLIMRRSLYHGQTLGLNEPFLYKISGHVVELMKGAYPELIESAQHVAKAIKIEEEQYAHTTRVGLERLETVPVVLRTGEDLPFKLARRLHHAIARLGSGGNDWGLADTFERVHSQYANNEERAAFLEWNQTLGPYQHDLPQRVCEWVLNLLPSGANQQDWFRKFETDVFQEVHNIGAFDTVRKALGRLQSRESIKTNPLLHGALESIIDRRFPPEDTQAWIPGDELFRLHDTFGIRPEIVEDLVKLYGFAIDRAGYDAEMQHQRERARASWKGAEKKVAPPLYRELGEKHPTTFDGYAQMKSTDCRVLALVVNGESVERVTPGTNAEVVLDHTPFYAETGGQIGDTGRLYSESGEEVAHVTDTQRPVTGLIVHKVTTLQPLELGMKVAARVDAERRDAIRRNHTATHLLHAALRTTLGTHVKQAGSLVAPDRLRFDFTHYAPLEEQDRLDIEDLVNRHILSNEEMHTDVMDIDSAINSGAMALFGEKYGDKVRVVSVADGSFSKELCGGTHVRRTGDIGLFKLVSESSVSAGTRRIEAVTGTAVIDDLRKASEALARLGETLRAKPGELLAAAEKLTESEKKLRKELEAQQLKRAAASTGSLVDQARDVKGVRVLSTRIEPMDRAAMRQIVDNLRTKLGTGVIVLGSATDGNVTLIAAVSKDLTAKLDAGKIVKAAAAIVEGSGGGRKDMAEAGGKNPAKLDESLAAVPGIVEQML